MSEIRVTTVSDTAGTGPVTLTKQHAAKAWVNWNGTSTVAIRDSFNVSSITDIGTGQYTVNFANALSDVNYSTSNSVGFSTSGGDDWVFTHERMDNKTTSSTRLYIAENTISSTVDMFGLFVSIHGDLA